MTNTDRMLDAALSLQFSAGFEAPARASYGNWAAAFVRRWGLVPENDQRARAYIANQNLRPEALTLVQAARAFHQSTFTIEPHLWAQFRKMEEDFDRVPPDLQEPPLTGPDWEKVEKQADEFDPKNPKRRGRVVFDMAGGTPREPAP